MVGKKIQKTKSERKKTKSDFGINNILFGITPTQ